MKNKSLKIFSCVLVFMLIVLFGTLTIVHFNKTSEIEGITLKDKTVVYDGLSHSLTIEGELPEGAEVVYENNDKVNAGIYKVKSTISCKGYTTKELTASLTIEKKDISGITFEDAIFNYDSKPHSLAIKGTLPEGVTVNYTNNNKIDVGSYNVTASFSDTTNNYNVPESMTAKLTINKIDYDLSKIKFEDANFTYDGKPHSLAIKGTLPDGVEVSYANNGKINAGEYTVTASFNAIEGDYAVANPMTATLTIDKADFDMSEVSFVSTNKTYNGKEQQLLVSGTLPEGVTVNYTNNKGTNVGDYQAKATFTHTNPNYNSINPLTATLTIDKADFDMSEVSFVSTNKTYNGKEQQLLISGTLPKGVTVNYTNNKGTDAGTYQAEATFTHTNPNYNSINPLTATLTIDKADYDMSSIKFNDESFDYDGTSHSIVIIGSLPKDVSVSYENNDKTNAGDYVVIASFTTTNKNYNNPNNMTANMHIVDVLQLEREQAIEKTSSILRELSRGIEENKRIPGANLEECEADLEQLYFNYNQTVDDIRQAIDRDGIITASQEFYSSSTMIAHKYGINLNFN